MGKKKEYNLSEIDVKQAEDNGTDKKESFTVQDYDAIANEGVTDVVTDGVTDQPCKQSADGDQDKVEKDSSGDVEQTEREEENEPIQNQTDCKGDENVVQQETTDSMDNHTHGYKTDNTETSKEQITTSKTEEEYTTIDLEETKHAPDDSKRKPVMFWVRKNFCLMVGISFVIVLIAIISISAASKREPSDNKDDMMSRKANPTGFEPATNENPNYIGYNTKDESTAPQFQSTESDIGNTPWIIDQDSETSQDHSTIESVTDATESVIEDENYDYPGIDDNLPH